MGRGSVSSPSMRARARAAAARAAPSRSTSYAWAAPPSVRRGCACCPSRVRSLSRGTCSASGRAASSHS
eukprot:303905-Prymnesium_polylepis.1